MESNVAAEIPAVFQDLFKDTRYKIFYGGRGSAKSWSFARTLVGKAYASKIRVLCTRELQTSIAESVHRILTDQITSMGLERFFTITQTNIVSTTGSEFIFKGLRHNANEIKSTEGIDICWIEEAQSVSKASYGFLLPTIRKEGSEVWISFNPELETDYTYQRFVLNPPAGAVCKKVSWRDNPWFTSALREEMEDLKARDYDDYLTIWEGHCRQTLDGAVYAKELRQATEENRITRVPYDPVAPVHTFWDLGWRDSTAIWFAQAIGFEYRIIDYYEGSQKTINHYLQVLQNKGYVYGTDYLPHDAEATTLVASGRTFEQLMRNAGRKVSIIPRNKVSVGLNAARTIFPNCWFDEEKCSDGLQCLRRYRYAVDPKTGVFGKEPSHDESSHGADAFRMLAMSIKAPVRGSGSVAEKLKKKQPLRYLGGGGGGGQVSAGWMG